MLESAFYLSCAGAACYLLGRNIKRRAAYLASITRVLDIRSLDGLLSESTKNPLVVVSGRVGCAAPLSCKKDGLLAVLVKENAVLDCEIDLKDGGLVETSLKFLLRQKETPWYLEDSTGQVNVLGVQDADGFHHTLKYYVFDMPASELFERVVIPQGTKVLRHNFHGHALDIGTVLTFVGEAVKDKAGNLTIQSPKEQSLWVCNGEMSFESVVDDMRLASRGIIMVGKVFGTIAVALVIMYGVEYLRKALLPFESEKEELQSKSDTPEDESDTREDETPAVCP